ncbi:MAG: tRNA uridine-5-carboxymethylaminomethyl(34) synthesis enzyme MnmG [Phycisphaerae bacterium]|nr:tRNA uridine-5-carboxymethylaminomethyl(34) synthesis enzyme MnmG [Phycisphaerae bacterium]
MSVINNYDVIVVGGGHAGAEAAHAAARIGVKTALVTMSRQTIAQLSCNPAIGGLAKGQIAREVDAMGGLMGLATDIGGIQFRMLNRSKGPAVWAPRAQADKDLYPRAVQDLLAKCPNLDIIEETAAQLKVTGSAITGLVCESGLQLEAPTVVLTAGTFLRGLMHLGTEQIKGGRFEEPSSEYLTDSLEQLGIHTERLKTGTPARIDAASIDYDKVAIQPGDEVPVPFSFLNDRIAQEQMCCWITFTNEQTHNIIRNNLDRAPMVTGQIQSAGPRYCPSIETKIMRFADKDRHQIFLEPEGRTTNSVYCNGISTSLPRDVQVEMIRSIKGLEHAKILRYAYAIEYDYVPPLQIRATLETKKVRGLFLAGQINGTSGYEEAAGQGLIAGVNAARYVKGQEPVILGRDQAYIGVLIDDLVTRGVDEPYRMFTSRAEHRLLLRSDNADERLTPLGRQWGVVDDNRWEAFQAKQAQKQQIRDYIESYRIDGKHLRSLLCQMGHDQNWLTDAVPELIEKNVDPFALQTIVNDIRYAGYVEKQKKLIERYKQTENVKLPRNFDYTAIPQLSNEAKSRLNKIQPENLGQASRVTGINPADITVLMVYLRKQS